MTDEAKRCVEALRFKEDFECIECPIPAGNCEENCMFDVAADLIESLSAELEATEAIAALARGLEVERDQLKARLEHVEYERDAAVEDMQKTPITLCNACAHYHTEFPCAGGKCSNKIHLTIVCSMFEWRGVKEDAE